MRRFAQAAAPLGLCLLLTPVALCAQAPHPTAAERAPATGTVKIVGYNDMRDMFQALVKLYRAAHPGTAVELDLRGTRFAPEALARDESALAPMGAEFTPAQLASYRARTGKDPIAFRVAHASLDPVALSGPLAIVVHRDNPLTVLSLPQLAKVFSGEVDRWSELGLVGAWAARPIRVAGVAPGTPLALFLQEKVLAGRPYAAAMNGLPQSAEVMAWVASHEEAIGFAAANRAVPGVRVLALAADRGGVALPPTEAGIADGSYPLDRHLLIYARDPLTPFAREFMRLTLSEAGQAAIAGAPQHYLPLSARELAAERAKLDETLSRSPATP